MNKMAYVAATAALLLWLTSSLLSAEDYYVEDFEGRDNVSFWCCGDPAFYGSAEEARNQKYMEIHFKGIVSNADGEMVYGGERSFKLDLTLPGRPSTNRQEYIYNYWRGPKINIPLDKPVYLSGYLYPKNVPADVEAALGWSAVGANQAGKLVQGNAPIREMMAVDNGWIFFQADLREALQNAGYKPGACLENWYLQIRGKFPFHGQRVELYLDDIRISSTRPESKTLRANPYVVDRHDSYFKERPFAAHNVMDNGSFELGLKNWQVSDDDYNGTLTEWRLDKKTVFHGKYSLKIFRPDNGTSTVSLTSQLTPVEDGQPYTLSFYARSDETTKVSLPQYGKSFAVSNTWQRCVVPINNIAPYKYQWSGKWIESRGLYSFALTQTGKGSLWIDAVQLEKGGLTDYRLPESVELGIYCERMGNVFHSGRPALFSINMFNATTNDVHGDVNYIVVDFEKKEVCRNKQRLSLAAGKGNSREVKLKLPPGYYKILAELEGESIPQKTAEMSFGIIRPISSKSLGPDAFFGMSALGQTRLNLNLQYRLFGSESGAKYGSVFGPFYWSWAPKNWRENNPQWKKADLILSAMEKYGIVPVAHLCNVPTWAGKSGSSAYVNVPEKPEEVTDRVIQEWYEYTYETVRRYKDRVKYWLIWAEFMYGRRLDERAAMYIKFVEAASEAIRAADPTAFIIGFGEDYCDRGWSLIAQMEPHFKLGSLDYVDAVGLDCYCHPESPESVNFGGMLDKLQEKIRQYNDGVEKDIWVVEVGWEGLDKRYSDLLYGKGGITDGKLVTDDRLVSELAQAENIVRMNLITQAKGGKRFLTYPLDQVGNIVNANTMALLNYAASSPKSAFVTYNHMVNSLANAKFEREIKIGGKILCYQFKKDAGSVVAIWNYDPAHKPIRIKGDFNIRKLSTLVHKFTNVFLIMRPV